MVTPDQDSGRIEVESNGTVTEFAFSGQSAGDYARQHNGNIYSKLQAYTEQIASDHALSGSDLHSELISAAARGRGPRVEYLMGLQANLDFKDQHGMTALHHSSLSGFEDVVRLLLRRGADVDAQSVHYGTPLCLAVIKDRVEVTRALLDERPYLGGPTGGLGTEIHCASWTGRCEIASMLLQSRAAVNQKARIAIDRLNMSRTWQSTATEVSAIDEMPIMSCFPLALAVFRGHTKMVKLLLEHGAFVDEECIWSVPRRPEISYSTASWPYRAAPVIVAAQHGYDEILELLISYGANIDIQDGSGYTALGIAAKQGLGKCVISLLKAKLDRTGSYEDDRIAFHLAVSGGHSDCIRAFCESGINLDAVNQDGHTALRTAASLGDVETAAILLNAGAKVDGQSTIGSSHLTIAAEQGHVTMMELLIGHGANLAKPKQETGSLFSNALNHGESQSGYAMLEMLLRSTQDNLSDSDLKDILTAFKTPQGSSREEVSAAMIVAAACAGNENALRALHRVGADPNARFSDGQTALHRVATERHFTAVLRLLDLEAQVNVLDQRGYSPLMYAIQQGQVQMVEKMIEYGADVNTAAKSGLTPIHLAVRYNATEVLAALLRNNADTLVQDLVEGNTPLHQAAMADNLAAAKLLLEYHASPDTTNNYGDTPAALAQKWSNNDVYVILQEFSRDNETLPGKAVVLKSVEHSQEQKGDSNQESSAQQDHPVTLSIAVAVEQAGDSTVSTKTCPGQKPTRAATSLRTDSEGQNLETSIEEIRSTVDEQGELKDAHGTTPDKVAEIQKADDMIAEILSKIDDSEAGKALTMAKAHKAPSQAGFTG
ncbi:Putative ankyrin repeat-containing domain superfamily [Septoria linicola]|uniref:Ankyrin repeat-containing domain superfamily n=1 Tax=Septoria linicola TaxID=215465 RepID=A0A9Q9B1C3_9PEZI|nr:putative ankyrin repeat-containing domain superfamily [Septoria linicola]USW58850.1 Putative ankyrin repeat-containing domain superfamily [Septoria linicola]